MPLPGSMPNGLKHRDPRPVREARVASFVGDGFLGPLQIFSAEECRRIAAYLHRPNHPAPADWEKGRAVHERFLYELAIHPTLLEPLTSLLGDNVVLWGASTVLRGPGDAHPWHSDIESSSRDGRFVTVWIGLEHTSRESSLQLIARSHRLGKTVQEARKERGLRRERATAEDILAAARDVDPQAALVQPDVRNGEALFFDGRLWHGSKNVRKRGQRLALLLQYAAADCPVHIPDLRQLDWPLRYRPTPRPPAILVSGSDVAGVNRLVPAPPPSSEGSPLINTCIHRFDVSLQGASSPWEPFPAFRGPTRTLVDMSCHASVLGGGHSPHPPHIHREEELLLPLRGEVELRIADSPDDATPRVERVSPGSFVYYPAGQHHTVRNPGSAPVQYLMFKWYAPTSQVASPLGTRVVHHADLNAPMDAEPYWCQRLFEGPTSCLGMLHAHLTVLQPGAGYAAHVDAYDVAIVMLSGTVETLGQVVQPLSVIYYGAGELHGMGNVGTEPARYLVFEFHAPGVELVPPQPPLLRSLPGRVLRLGRRLARPFWNRLKPHLPVAATRAPVPPTPG